jgi:hypothetical protein
MLISITKAAGLGSDSQLIYSLREQSAELLKFASNFSDIYDAFDIFCFYELLPWKFGSVVRMLPLLAKPLSQTESHSS